MSNDTIVPYPDRRPAAHLQALIARAQTSLQTDTNAAAADIRRALELVGRLKGDPVEPAAGALAAWQANRVARHIEDHFGERLDVESLATVTRLSVRQFSRAFKASFGVTPAVYVQGLRLARVRVRLLTMDEPLAATALACGFSDETQLCRAFRKATGQSPKAWRRREPKSTS